MINKNSLQVGYGRANITPRYPDGNFMPVRTAGYPDKRICCKILTDLYASCTAFRDADGNTALLFSVDIISFPNDDAEYAIDKISQETGVARDHIILNATHTHTAPGLRYPYMEEIKYYKDNILFDGLVKAAKLALEDLTLCTDIYVGVGDGTGYNFVRRYDIDEEGNMHHEYEADHSIPVAKFVREGKKDVLLASWEAHCDTVAVTNRPDFYSVSADYVEAFRNKLERELDAHVSMHISANGDVNPFSKVKGEFKFPGTIPYGEAIADRVLEALPKLRKIDATGPVKMISARPRFEINHSRDNVLDKAIEISRLYEQSGKTPELDQKCKDYDIFDVNEATHIIIRSRLPKDEEMPVWALRVGGIAFGVAPYEMFTKTAMDIKAASPFDLTFVCAYSNGTYSYIPADYCFNKYDYEVYVCRYLRGSAEKVQREISKLIDELYKL